MRSRPRAWMVCRCVIYIDDTQSYCTVNTFFGSPQEFGLGLRELIEAAMPWASSLTGDWVCWLVVLSAVNILALGLRFFFIVEEISQYLLFMREHNGESKISLGYGAIGAEHAEAFQKFYTAYFNPYLNFHRPCGYATVVDQPAGKAQTDLSPQGLPDALRKAHLVKGMDGILEARHHGRRAETAGRGPERHGGCAARAESQDAAAGAKPENSMRAKRGGNAGAVESVESQKQAFPSFHEPLEISPTAGEIPTFPPRRRRRRMGKWKTKNRFPTFPPPRCPWKRERKNQRTGRTGLRPSARHNKRKEHPPGHPKARNFQAHPALESNTRFRLISRWNQFSISGSFVDWKMLAPRCGPSTRVLPTPSDVTHAMTMTRKRQCSCCLIYSMVNEVPARGAPMVESLTQLFEKAQQGNREAENALYRLVSFRLRHIANALMQREHPGHTLQPTALVSEFFLRARGLRWGIRNEEDFFHLSARVMKQVLVDHARRRRTRKRMAPEGLHELLASTGQTHLSPETRIAVNTALEELRGMDPVAATTVWQRCVEGMTLDELSRSQGRDIWRVRADCDFGLQWMAGQLGHPSD